MPRNLERRIELLFPIIDEEVFQNLKDLLLIYFSDNQKAFLLQSDGSWKQRNREKGEEKIRAQKLIHESFKKKNETLYNNAREFTVRRSQAAET
jgi:polyphosphate kinase